MSRLRSAIISLTGRTAQSDRSAAEFSGMLTAINKSQAVIEFSLDGRVIHANENFLAATGYSLEEIIGAHHRMFVEPELHDSAEYRAFWDKLNRGEFDAGQYKRLGKGGKVVWLQATYYPILDAAGTPLKVTKFATDITEQQLSVEGATRVRAALETCTTNVMVADQDYKITYMNESIRVMMSDAEAELKKMLPQFDSASLLGQSIDIFHRNPAHQRRLLDKLNAPYHAEISVGSLKFRLIATPIRDSAGKRLGTVVEWKNQTAEKAIEEELSGVITATLDGDLTRRVRPEGKSGFTLNLANSMNSLCESFSNFVAQTQIATTEVSSAATEISASTTDLSQRTEEQAASLEQTSAAMEEMAATVNKNAESAQTARASSEEARAVADRGGLVVANAVEAMARIEESSRKITDIIGVIDEIARQTNLLALNAAVEAARAGEAGRGFAVVASEVRSLAQRSSQAAKDIKDLIVSSTGHVKEGVDLVSRAGQSLSDIVESIKAVSNIVADIAAASAEQSIGISEVNKALSQMDEATQQNSALVEQNAATAKTLEQQAKEMDARMSSFRIVGAAPIGSKDHGFSSGRSNDRLNQIGTARRETDAPNRSASVRRIAPANNGVRRTALAMVQEQDAWQEF